MAKSTQGYWVNESSGNTHSTPATASSTSQSKSSPNAHQQTLDQKRAERDKKNEEGSPNEKREVVMHGAELKCQYAQGPGKLVVTSNEIKLQDQLWATEGDGNNMVNLQFKGTCGHPNFAGQTPPPCMSVIKLSPWQNLGTSLVQEQKVLVKESYIVCNPAPNVATPSQIPIVESLANKEAKEDSDKILKYKWTSDKEGTKEITKFELHEVVHFHIELPNTINDITGTLKLYNDNGTLSHDYMHIDKKVEFKNGKGYIGLDLVSILEVKGDEINQTLQTWKPIVEGEYGNEIELYWKFIYSKGTKSLKNKNNDVFVDEYCIAILRNKYRYTCNAGWIDKSHAFETTTRAHVGADNLWKQLIHETGLKTSNKRGFQVIYTQDAKLGPIKPGVTKKYMVAFGLNNEIKKRIAMAIFQEVSLEFENFQAMGTVIGKGDSSFEPADLVSNLLGLYKVLRNETKDVILSRCNELNARKSLKVYRKYPNTFSKSIYKNKKFTPRYFSNDDCISGVFPKEYQEVQPYPKTNEKVFRDWIDIIDIYEGRPSMSGPKH
jgi:hypothetical protein